MIIQIHIKTPEQIKKFIELKRELGLNTNTSVIDYLIEDFKTKNKKRNFLLKEIYK